MKVTKRYNQSRRDLSIDLECEGCGATVINRYAYDDHNFWDNVIPGLPCKKCKQSSVGMGSDLKTIPTKYSDDEVV